MIKPGKFYSEAGLANAMDRACVRAGIPRIRPYDLRRTAATRVRAVLGKEDAAVLLGHTDTTTTDIYLLEEVKEQMRVAKLIDQMAEQPGEVGRTS